MSHAPRAAVVALTAPAYRFGLSARRSVAAQRRVTQFGARLNPAPKGTVVRQVRLGECPAERVTLGDDDAPRAVLYLHGGGYVVGSGRMYRTMAAHLSRAAGAVVFCLDYRLAPEHRYPAALEDALAAFRALVDAGYPAERIAIAGDSAGGGLAVAAARALTDSGQRPAALGLLSPWTDPSDTELPERDFVTNKAWGSACAAMYRGDAERTDPGYAPMYAELSGLPPMLITTCTTEILNGQIHRFAGRAQAAGCTVRLVEDPRLWHSGQILAGMLREATDSVHDIGVFLRAHLDADRAEAQPG